MKFRRSKLRPKLARRWLKRNAWQIAQFNLSLNSSYKSSFGKQLLMCRRSLR